MTNHQLSTKIPALFINKEAQRNNAKKIVAEAVQNIRAFGALAGISDRSLFEFVSLSKFIEAELAKKPYTAKL